MKTPYLKLPSLKKNEYHNLAYFFYLYYFSKKKFCEWKFYINWVVYLFFPLNCDVVLYIVFEMSNVLYAPFLVVIKIIFKCVNNEDS